MKLDPSISEADFARIVLESCTNGELVLELLREEHPVYRERSSSTVVSMRGWVFLAIARRGLTDTELLFVLEELETGVDPYLIAAAAFALRTYPRPEPFFAPLVIVAVNNIRFTDEPVDLASYGGFDPGGDTTTALNELLSVLMWLGPAARDAVPDLVSLCRGPAGLKREMLKKAEIVLSVITDDPDPAAEEHPSSSDCCDLTSLIGGLRSGSNPRGRGQAAQPIVFEDQDGGSVKFEEFFKGRPSIVVFFYTRCDNPLKCSLTITKLASMQRRLRSEGHADDINVVGITYDSAFDIPQRLKQYGTDRGFRPGSRSRLLRTTNGFDRLRDYFGLHVNFVESLVNRHTVSAYILDSDGELVNTFDRHLWDENEMTEKALEVLARQSTVSKLRNMTGSGPGPAIFRSVFGFLPTLAFALFPKCPICWLAYLSLFGIGSIVQIPYSPWIMVALAVLMAINIATVWLRCRASGRMLGLYMVSAGSLLILLSRLEPFEGVVATAGAALTLIGSLLSVGQISFNRRTPGNTLSVATPARTIE